MIQKIIRAVSDNPLIYNLIQTVLEGDYHQRIITAVEARPEETLLDIGCGTGYFSQFFSCDYTGVDIEKKYLDYAQKKYGQSNKKFQLITSGRLPFPDKSFDKVMCINVIHHLDDQTVSELLLEIIRVARKELVIFDMDTAAPSVVTPLLLKLDNGKFMRSLSRQVELVSSKVSVDQQATFVTPRGLLTHSLIKCRII